MDGYMNAIYKHDPKAVPPLAIDVRMTENTGRMEVGEGVLWRSKVELTPFKIYIADHGTGQVALQARLLVQGRSALVAVRLKANRGQISEIEQLYDRNINDAAIPLLTTPRPGLVSDVPPSERESRARLRAARERLPDCQQSASRWSDDACAAPILRRHKARNSCDSACSPAPSRSTARFSLT
jgi:hypothetical protein